jgi:hypothetical protein
MKKGETIREWYHRTTNKWIKGLVGATVVALIAAGLLYGLAQTPFLAKLQTFNGAFTIPIAGAIWLLSFVYIFLVPNREVGFRSMESFERMEDRLVVTIDQKLVPVIDVWTRVGESVEAEIKNGLIKEMRDAVSELRGTCKRLEESAKDGAEFAKEAKPAIEALKRIGGRVEREIESGFIEDTKAVIQGLRGLPPKNGASEPDVAGTLAALRSTKP